MSEEILNKYIELINKDYCSDCNELNCIDNFPHKKIANAIKELQLENQILKNQLNEMQMNKTNYTEVNILTMLNHKYKSVLDEIRAYINNIPFKDLEPIEVKVISKILDKVKE